MIYITFQGYRTETDKYLPEKIKLKFIELVRVHLVLRFCVELPCSPSELVLLKRDNLHEYTINGITFATLDIKEGSKKVKRGGKFIPRHRTVILNSDLYRITKKFLKLHKSCYIIPKFEKVGIRKKIGVRVRINNPLSPDGARWIHKQATRKWNQHKVINNRLGAKHMFKTFVKRACRDNKVFYDEEVMRALMGHVPRDSHGVYGSYVFDLETAFDMIETTFGRAPVICEHKNTMTVESVVKLFS